MRKFFSAVLLLAAAGGAIWFENQPTTVKIPVETSDEVSYREDTPTATEVVETTQPHHDTVKFGSPDVTMEVNGSGGDEVRLREVISKPKHLDALPSEVESVIRSCPGATDRDMVVQVDSQVELLSPMAAEISVNYKTLGNATAFDYSSGLVCDEGNTTFNLQPGSTGRLTYWVILRGVITPQHPDGYVQDYSSSSEGLSIMLPNGDLASWKLWGRRVVQCDSLLGTTTKVWFAGLSPSATDSDCHLITTKDRAYTNS